MSVAKSSELHPIVVVVLAKQQHLLDAGKTSRMEDTYSGTAMRGMITNAVSRQIAVTLQHFFRLRQTPSCQQSCCLPSLSKLDKGDRSEGGDRPSSSSSSSSLKLNK
jgi:hypothetical protein